MSIWLIRKNELTKFESYGAYSWLIEKISANVKRDDWWGCGRLGSIFWCSGWVMQPPLGLQNFPPNFFNFSFRIKKNLIRSGQKNIQVNGRSALYYWGSKICSDRVESAPISKRDSSRLLDQYSKSILRYGVVFLVKFDKVAWVRLLHRPPVISTIGLPQWIYIFLKFMIHS